MLQSLVDQWSFCCLEASRSVTRASYEIMSRSFCCLRETETTDESRCDFNVDVVRGFWRQSSGSAATAQTDRLFSISLHGLTHTLARPALSSFSSNTPAHSSTHQHTGRAQLRCLRFLIAVPFTLITTTSRRSLSSLSLSFSFTLSVSFTRAHWAQQARTFIQGERAGAGISLAAPIPWQIPPLFFAQNTRTYVVLNSSNTQK